MVKAGVLVAEAGCWFGISERERNGLGERGGR